jgi:CRP-like cAMP-binding protein
VIDRIRKDIQERLDQLLAEVEKLRRALVALDPREQPTAPRAERSKPTPARKEPARKSASPKTRRPESSSARTQTRAARSATPRARTAPGVTKAKVLSALSGDGALTAGDVAKVTGLGRASVSTMLSKLANSGEVVKAQRGYRLPG